MIPSEWNALLAPSIGWKEAYAAVAREARATLVLHPIPDGDHTLTTSEFVELLYPERFARGEGITARKRIFKALAALAAHDLKDCCTRGEPRKVTHGTRMVRPWLWHEPKTAMVTRYSEQTISNLEAFGWLFCMTGPNEWAWLKFNEVGNMVAQQGDERWRRDVTMAENPT